MKKLFLSTLILTALFFCKKTENADTNTQENQTEKIDSVASTAPIESEANIKIVDQNQLTTLVAPKKNEHLTFAECETTAKPSQAKPNTLSLKTLNGHQSAANTLGKKQITIRQMKSIQHKILQP